MIMITSRMPGTSDADYEHLAAALLPILTTTDGFVSHAAGPTDEGYLVTELWESEAAHTAWFEANVRPTMPQEAMPPIITVQSISRLATRA